MQVASSGHKRLICAGPLAFSSFPHLYINLKPLALPDTFPCCPSLFVSDSVWEQVRRFSIVLWSLMNCRVLICKIESSFELLTHTSLLGLFFSTNRLVHSYILIIIMCLRSVLFKRIVHLIKNVIIFCSPSCHFIITNIWLSSVEQEKKSRRMC